VGNLQIDLKRLGERVFENEMIINPAKSKAVCFTKARVTESINYSIGNIIIPEKNICEYLAIILRRDISWADQVNYMVKKAWRLLHFTVRILKTGKSNTSVSHS
jgi:hypothetical protein